MLLFAFKETTICENKHITKHEGIVPVLKSSLYGGNVVVLCHLIFFVGKYLERNNKYRCHKINRYVLVMN